MAHWPESSSEWRDSRRWKAPCRFVLTPFYFSHRWSPKESIARGRADARSIPKCSSINYQGTTIYNRFRTNTRSVLDCIPATLIPRPGCNKTIVPGLLPHMGWSNISQTVEMLQTQRRVVKSMRAFFGISGVTLLVFEFSEAVSESNSLVMSIRALRPRISTNETHRHHRRTSSQP